MTSLQCTAHDNANRQFHAVTQQTWSCTRGYQWMCYQQLFDEKNSTF